MDAWDVFEPLATVPGGVVVFSGSFATCFAKAAAENHPLIFSLNHH